MSPTREVREAVYKRDGKRCVACNRPEVTFQHRRAVGMGGSKIRPSVVDGLALCGNCNQACEGSMQTLALASGWKARRWADPMRVPVYYPHEHAWFRFESATRYEITAVRALDLMHSVYGDQYFEWRDN